MSLEVRSKRERCPDCDSRAMNNLVYMRPGQCVHVFVECAECGAFVARYALREYTCDDPFRSFLRRMRRRQSSSGGEVSKDAAGHADQLRADYLGCDGATWVDTPHIDSILFPCSSGITVIIDANLIAQLNFS